MALVWLAGTPTRTAAWAHDGSQNPSGRARQAAMAILIALGVRDVDQHPVQIGQMMFAEGTFLEEPEPRRPFRPGADGARGEAGVPPDQLLEIFLESLDALDLEADVLERGPLDARALVVVDVPRHDDQRHPAVG